MSARVRLEEIEPCERGEIRHSVSLDDLTGLGTVTAEYRDCVQGGFTYNGTVNIRIDAWGPGFSYMTDYTNSYERFTTVGPGIDQVYNGSHRIQRRYGQYDLVETFDLVHTDNLSGRQRYFRDLKYQYESL